MKKRYIVIALLAVMLVASTVSGGKQQKSPKGLDSSESSAVSEEHSLEQPEEAEEFINCSDKAVKRFFNEYNRIAEYKITPDSVRDSPRSGTGAYWSYLDARDSSFIRVGHPKGFLSDAEDTYIDLKTDALPKSTVFCYFRDICKTLSPNLTDERIEDGWQAILTGEYDDVVKTYDLDGIEIGTEYNSMIKGDLAERTDFFMVTFSTFLYPYEIESQ